MAYLSAIKTATSTATSACAGASEMPGRTYVRIRNLDDSVAMTANGRHLEPGEDTKFSLTGLGTETIMVQSKGRALPYEIQEVA